MSQVFSSDVGYQRAMELSKYAFIISYPPGGWLIAVHDPLLVDLMGTVPGG